MLKAKSLLFFLGEHLWTGIYHKTEIDGVVATIMALDRAIRCGLDNGESVYDERGILLI